MKTTVIMTDDDRQHQEWKKDEVGYIDGYVQGGLNQPLVCIVLGDRVVLAYFHSFKVTGLLSAPKGE